MLRSWVLATALIATGGAASALQMPPVEIAFAAGRVTVSAADAPLADVLAAWARAGHTDVTGAEYLGARRISIRLTNASEADALRAIIGSPDWYTTVARDSTPTTESIFQRIVIQPSALTVTRGDAVAAPELRYSYYSDPNTDALAAAQAAVPSSPPVSPRPANVEPESFYHYDPVQPDAPEAVASAIAPARLLPPLPLSATPEEIYTYSPTPEVREPSVSSAAIPPPPAAEPEVRFTYDATPQEPPHLYPTRLVVPNLPAFQGWIGLRLPGRVIRYVAAQ